MINVLTAIWTFLGEHFWTIVVLTTAILFGRTLHQKYVYEPLAGEDGKVQMDELGKGIIMGILIWAVQRDGYRTHEWTYFTDAFYAALLAGIFAIAAIKPIASVLNGRFHKQGKSTVQDIVDGDSSSPNRDSSTAVGDNSSPADNK